MTAPAPRAQVRESADGLRMARAVRQLSARDDWAGRLVRRAIVDALGRREGRVERRRMLRIEALRQELAASDAVVGRIDFGGDDGVPVLGTIGELCRRSSTAPAWSRLLFHLAREAAPVNALELGTALGFSAAYQGAALEGNGHGRLVTIEGAPPLADLARDHLARIGIGTVEVVTGRFRDALPPVLERLQPLEFVYIDGHDDGRATLDYFGTLLPAITRPALLVFDDIGISPGMRAAWEEIAQHPRVTLAVDLHKLGVCGVR